MKYNISTYLVKVEDYILVLQEWTLHIHAISPDMFLNTNLQTR